MPIRTEQEIVDIVRTRGDLTIDLAADAGATPGYANAEDTREALQRMVAACRPGVGRIRETGNVGVWFVIPRRAETWYISREVWIEQEKINILGAGAFLPGISLDPARHGPALIFGISRTPFGVAVPTARFASLGGSPERFSFLADRSHWLAQRAGVLDMAGDCWRLSGFTVQFAWVQAGTDQPIGPMCGLSDRDWPRPWRLHVSEGSAFGATNILRLEMLVRAASRAWSDQRPPEQGDIRAVSVPAPTGAGAHSVVFRVNLATGLVRAWVDGVQVQVRAWNGAAVVDVTGLSAAYTPGPALRLEGNEHSPFLIGSASVKCNFPGSDFIAIAGNYALTVAGMKLSLEDQYQDLGVGQPLTPAAGRSADIYTGDAGTIAYLPMTRDGATAAPSRSVDVQVGVAGDPIPTVGSMFIYSNEHATPSATFGGHVLRDLVVSALPNGGGFGKALSFGYASYVWIEGGSFDGGAQGLGDENFGASYTLNAYHPILGGGDCAVWAEISILKIRDPQLFRMGRWCFRFATCDAEIIGAFIAPTGTPDGVVRAVQASDVKWSGSVDIEFGEYPRICAFYCETSADSTLGGRLDLELKTGNMPPAGKPLVILRSPAGVTNMGYLGITNLLMFPNGQSAIVDVRGPYWRCDVRLDHPIPGVPIAPGVPSSGSKVFARLP